MLYNSRSSLFRESKGLENKNKLHIDVRAFEQNLVSSGDFIFYSINSKKRK